MSALVMGCGTGMVYIFAARAPFIGIRLMHLEPDVFGYYNLIPVVGMFLGSYLSSKFAGKISILKLLMGGISTTLTLTVLMLGAFAFFGLHPLSLFLPIVLINGSQSIVYANISSFALTTVKNKSNGSAVLNFTNLSMAVLSVLVSGMIYPESAFFLPISFVALGFLMLWIGVRLRKCVASS